MRIFEKCIIKYACVGFCFLFLLDFQLIAVCAEPDSYLLRSKRKAGTVDEVNRTLDVRGMLIYEVDAVTGQSVASAAGGDGIPPLGPGGVPRKLQKQTRKIPISVTGNQTYEEMLVASGNLLQGESAKPTLGAWYFLRDDAKFVVEAAEQTQKLDERARLFGVNIHDAEIRYFRPESLLTREERDLLDQQGISLLLDFLLPNREVKIGESWAQSADVMGLLLQLDMVFQLEVKTTLKEVKGKIAVLETEGWIEGSSDGTASKMNLKCVTYFHLVSGRIVWNGITLKEKRSAGHVAPEMDVSARVQYTIKPLKKSENLTEEVLSKIVFDDALSEKLMFLEPGGLWRCEMDARWYPTIFHERQATFRMVEKGDLIAQCTVLTSPKTLSPVQLTLDGFFEEIKKTFRGEIKEVRDSSKLETEDGTIIYRVEFTGEVDGLSISWIYYYIYKLEIAEKKESARQVTVAFTVEENLLGTFGTSDQQMIQTFQWEP
ncbi:MAG: hypothetical protein Q4C96_09795 [Planctomycetia bacterium]|nr:hypothetical protein [Planctomycetia bacterium]